MLDEKTTSLWHLSEWAPTDGRGRRLRPAAVYGKCTGSRPEEPLLPTYSVHPLLPSEAIWSQFLRIQYVYSSSAVVDSEEDLAYKTRSTVERDRIHKNGGRYPVRNRDRIRLILGQLSDVCGACYSAPADIIQTQGDRIFFANDIIPPCLAITGPLRQRADQHLPAGPLRSAPDPPHRPLQRTTERVAARAQS